MYSTYLRTALEPRFRRRLRLPGLSASDPDPALVILGAMYAFIVLLTVFFFWASVHVTHQAQCISETYRRQAAGRVRTLDRLLDGAVILGALYTVAMYKFVEDRFALGYARAALPGVPEAPLGRRSPSPSGSPRSSSSTSCRTLGEIRRGETSLAAAPLHGHHRRPSHS